jgi:superfamily II DNA or RNA helicase
MFPKINSYLGQKGYTILKSEIPPSLQNEIKEELTVKPYTPGSPVQNTTTTFPVYRESGNKLYLPRYYAESKFGPPKEIKIPDGDDINLTFNGSLRDYQVPVVEKFLAHVRRGQTDGGLLELPCAFGKTSLSLYIMTQLRKKTLVIIHKEFLLNQWVERIKQFIPNARIGRIQGPTIDIEDKDIVLCMLQSLSMKDYDASVFNSFGFTIIDECHHISSEVFSRALFKLVTKYMLGLSATMNRKDGTTKVFKMFLGDVVHKATRSKDEQVIVRGITFKTDDDEFNEVKTDFRGNVAYSTMISKLCSYNRRTEFIIRIIEDMIKDNNKVQIMVIAHNKNILTYIHDAIEHRNIATVGYYVGGMKEAALKNTESKQVIIATYAMCSEGLDIKTLNALIMTTPKTDIEQTVGRILREKHATPIVVDIIDAHDPFQNQWQKRKRYYKSQNYKIIETDSNKYTNDYTKWRLSFQPSWNENISCTKSSSDEEDEQVKPVGKCLIKLKK